MRWFLLAQAVITAATSLVLLAAPDAIPASFGLELTVGAHLLCYFYAATELSLAYLSVATMRGHDSRAARLLYGYFLFVHAVEGAAGLYAVVQGSPAKVLANSGAHFGVASVFALAVFRRALSNRIARPQEKNHVC